MPGASKLKGLLFGPTARVAAVRMGGMALGLAVTSLAAHILDPAGFGAYTFVVAVVTMASIPISFGLRQMITRETSYAVARGDEAHLRPLLAWSLKAAAITALLDGFAIAAWALLGTRGPLRGELLVGVLALLVMPAPQIVAGLLQGTGRVVRSLLPEFVVRPLVAVMIFAGFRWLVPGPGPSVQTMLLVFAGGVVAETLASLIFLDRRRYRSAAEQPGAIDGKALAYASLSFSAIAGIHVLNNNLDIIMLKALRGNVEVGLYRSAVTLSAIPSFAFLIVNAVNMAKIGYLHEAGNKKELQSIVTKGARMITGAAFLACVALLVVGKPLLSVLFGPEFAGAYPALAILLIGGFANSFFGQVGTILNMTGHERLTLVGVGIALLVNGILNVLLIPRFGIEGAAIATASSLVLWNVILAGALWRRTGVNCTAF